MRTKDIHCPICNKLTPLINFGEHDTGMTKCNSCGSEFEYLIGVATRIPKGETHRYGGAWQGVPISTLKKLAEEAGDKGGE